MGTIYRGDDLDDRHRRALDAWLEWHGLRYYLPSEGTVELHGAWAVVECLKLKRGQWHKRGRGFDRRIFELGPDGLPDEFLRHTVRVRIRRPLSDFWPSADREPVNHHPITAEQRAALVAALAAMPAIAAGVGGAFRAAAEAAHSMSEAIRRANAATRDDFGLLPAPVHTGERERLRLVDVDTGATVDYFEVTPEFNADRVSYVMPSPAGDRYKVLRRDGDTLRVRRAPWADEYRPGGVVRWAPNPSDDVLDDPDLWNATTPPLGIKPEGDKLRDALAGHHKRREADNDEKGTHHE